MQMENNNKELYALLEMYNSNSASESPEVVINSRKKKRLTKHRRKQANSQGVTPQVCAGRTVSLTLALLLLLCWLLTLTWLAIVLNAQIQRIDITIQSVVAGSQGVPEALQKCHTISKQLQQNQTALFLKLDLLTTQLNNFTTQVTTISSSLSRVEQRFKASPELITVPHDLNTLTENIASMGSQLQDLVTTVVTLKDTDARLSETAKGLEVNITNLKKELLSLNTPVAVNVTSNVDIQAVNTTINTLRSNLSLINDTLSKKIQWAQEDQANQYKQIVNLQERNENVSTRVTSLQNECSAQGTQLTTLVTSVDKLSSKVIKQEEHWTQMSGRMSELSKAYSELRNSSSQLSEQLNGMKRTFNMDSTLPVSTSETLNTTSVNATGQIS